MDISVGLLKNLGSLKIEKGIFETEKQKREFKNAVLILNGLLDPIKVVPYIIPKMWGYIDPVDLVQTKKFKEWVIKVVPFVVVGESNPSVQKKVKESYNSLWSKFFSCTDSFTNSEQSCLINTCVKFPFLEFMHLSDDASESMGIDKSSLPALDRSFKLVNNLSEALYSWTIICDNIARDGRSEFEEYLTILSTMSNSDFVKYLRNK